MKISKETLQQESKLTGFKMEHLEKVLILMDLLSDFASFPQLKNKIVLKGGTALNIFFFNLPRLSVDIDLNYIGNIDKNVMQKERSSIREVIQAICVRNGLTLDRNPNRHAGGKMIWRYSSALGQMGNLEIDLNFMYRVPLWPIDFKSSCLVGSKQIHNIPVSMGAISTWSNNLVKQCQKNFSQLLPITTKERAFLTNLLDKGLIEPQLISDDDDLINNIENHPAIRWSAQQAAASGK